ncbi:hypothetical protein MSHI_19790 [Mycobacterium shinjukuense]|uniref:NADP-dependent oxidoreductase domain-containing protein n=1 Tax=Mycobacterium shinjukuense TaxID=398694 RepID=A0A7I7MR95_9MYCO|nr:aldo/keto reductase [Mycobacterium shinjukuense]BBX74073.1 hypothetical protein MSHI_19790 [Mycobacterium shinjukuense]
MTTPASAAASGTFTLGGDLTVNRLGFGAMRLTGTGVWGSPEHHPEAVRVLRRAVELGVNFIDTADSYGPYVSEEIIREALHPYAGPVIATKAGLLRTGPNVWIPLGHPSYLRQECEMSLRRLGVEAIDPFQLHRIDRNVPLADQVGEPAALKNEGKIRHIGLCEVDVEQLRAAQQITPIVSVQNRYNLTTRAAEPLLDVATGLAAGPAGDGADSGHVAGGAPGGERRRRRDHPFRRGVRDPGRGRRPAWRLSRGRAEPVARRPNKAGEKR